MKRRSDVLQQILHGIRDSHTLCVAGHTRPDGDCIGSQVGLALALQGAGKKVTVWNEDSVPRKLRFLVPEGLWQEPRRRQKFDAVIATDCANLERLGTVAACITNRKLLINIDHHESNSCYGDLNWVSAKEPATGELIFKLIKKAGWTVTPAIADCLFTAISTDTGSFLYPTTRPSTFRVAAELVRHGANLARVCDEVYQSYSLSRVRLLQHVYNTFQLAHDNQLAYFWLRAADYRKSGAASSESEGLIDHIRDIEPVIVACVFEEISPDLTRVSLRSKSSRVKVNEIVTPFGGGGHPAAAGARIRGRPRAVEKKVIAAIEHALNGLHP